MEDEIHGVPWFRAVDYDEALEIMDDKRIFPTTHEAWQQRAQAELDSLSETGAAVFKAYISPPSFLAWCIENQQRPNEDGRRAYARYLAEQVAKIDWGAKPAGSRGNGHHADPSASPPRWARRREETRRG